MNRAQKRKHYVTARMRDASIWQSGSLWYLPNYAQQLKAKNPNLEIATYGCIIVADNQAVLYERITGRRSSVFG